MKDQKKSPGNGAFLLHAVILKREEHVLSKNRHIRDAAELSGKEEHAPALVFICHMDTVVVGDG